MTRNTSISWHNQIGQAKTRKATHSLAFQFYYLSFPIYVLLDLDMFSASIEITYSVQVVLRFLLADKRNLPFSISTADPHQKKKEKSTIAFRNEGMLGRNDGKTTEDQNVDLMLADICQNINHRRNSKTIKDLLIKAKERHNIPVLRHK